MSLSVNNNASALLALQGLGQTTQNLQKAENQVSSGLAINSASDVPNPDGKDSYFTFKGEEDLVQGLAKQEICYQCFAAYLTTYAFGTGESCLGSGQVADFYAGSVGIADLFAGLSTAPHFTTRSAQ